MISPQILSLISDGNTISNPAYFAASSLIAALSFSIIISFINGRKK